MYHTNVDMIARAHLSAIQCILNVGIFLHEQYNAKPYKQAVESTVFATAEEFDLMDAVKH